MVKFAELDTHYLATGVQARRPYLRNHKFISKILRLIWFFVCKFVKFSQIYAKIYTKSLNLRRQNG
ncbi:MAG: hypothetical protein IJT33_01040 [Campylobacter sp.]|nr:hypothetical protein [Campylobacter sp.]MBQ7675036.1 hypothetical protein [Campylobacter sp.]MBQ9877103.1 hypothetical protein [Campylobacter sp.]